jgi:hypothetical protein
MNPPAPLRVYRGLLWLYPAQFRNDYGDDMVFMFAEQLRDESPVRVWTRGVVDLAIAVPTNHLEAHMHRSAHSLVPALLAGASLTAVIAGLIVGSSLPRPVLIGLIVFAFATGWLAVTALRRTRPIATERPASAHWWKFLIGGATALTAFAAITTSTGAVSDPWWLPMMGVLLCAIATLGVGVVLGIVRLVEQHPRAATS